MSSDQAAITVSNLSKCYHVYQRPQDRLRQSIFPRIQRLFGRRRDQYYREFWALRDVSLAVRRGETVGIIGRNGSGKSTLLQMICGTLQPSAGEIQTHGRVAALLELGAGFNPEFTGRENVILNATVLGLSSDAIRDRFEKIAAFADIGEFIEQPVKHYSSGMYARLAFAVAINVDPDILIVDEALAVGDEPFQRKCFSRIEQIKQLGGTIIFVSHSSSAIVELCDRALVLHNGRAVFIGQPKTAIGVYHKLVNLSSTQQITDIQFTFSSLTSGAAENLETHPPPVSSVSANAESGADNAYYDQNLRSASLISFEPNGGQIRGPRITLLHSDEQVNCLISGERYRFRYLVEPDRNLSGIRLYCAIKTVAGIVLGGGAWPALGTKGVDLAANRTHEMIFDFCCRLNSGTYFFNCGVEAPDGSLVHRIIDALPFRVLSNRSRSSTATVDFDIRPEMKF